LTQSVLLHRAPAAGFDQPFEMLAACHERVERMLGLLERLAAHLPRQGADAQARDAARDVMRYFDQAAPQHHEDEERHVLPALREAARESGQAALAALADRLHADHEQMAAAWAALRVALAGIVAGQGPPGVTLDAVPGFAALYRAHIEREDREAFPAAAVLVRGAMLETMGEEMATRRGVR
jgi:hemerythrin-like domain-containing protein